MTQSLSTIRIHEVRTWLGELSKQVELTERYLGHIDTLLSEHRLTDRSTTLIADELECLERCIKESWAPLLDFYCSPRALGEHINHDGCKCAWCVPAEMLRPPSVTA